ncbi:iron chelate uptake ABC transporter family permease subunit [Salinibius halmophilus]|uniref:iron chelate uptake ABC transporter family permease subunit n=1 Tax=Salinibius halmophilus TaxID=1853216 RepID=UPI000E672B05|nr:iron chelate uptake ABC transporter family permease subunit [Salinibius halmophilus]
MFSQSLRQSNKSIYIGLIFLALWMFFAVWHVSAGAVAIPWREVLSNVVGYSDEHEFIIMGYRLPRMLIASLVGASLALSGLLVQGVIRNPLASPDVLGVTAGASLAVVFVNAMLPDIAVVWFPVIALIGGGISTVLLLSIAKPVLHHPAALALIGIALAAVMSAGIDYFLISRPMEINLSLIWMTGSVWGRNWSHLPILLSFFAVLLPCAIWLAYRLDLLSLGDQTAHGIGVDVQRLRIVTLLVAISLACVAVSVCGNIGFIGLIAPHAARFLFGNRHIALIPLAMLIGAVLLLSADLFARILMPPIELPAGILTALIGAPYFIFLLSRYKHW